MNTGLRQITITLGPNNRLAIEGPPGSLTDEVMRAFESVKHTMLHSLKAVPDDRVSPRTPRPIFEVRAERAIDEWFRLEKRPREGLLTLMVMLQNQAFDLGFTEGLEVKT